MLAGLRRFFGLGDPGVDVPPTEAFADPPTAAQPGTAPVGRFSLVGLQQVREELGDRWPDLAERVERIAETIIGRHLLPGDVFEKNGAGDYVVLFCQLTETEAEFKARVIAQEITRRLLGTEWQTLSLVEAVCTVVPRAAAQADRLDAFLATSFARARPFISNERALAAAPEDGVGSASPAVALGGALPSPVRAPTTATPIRLPPAWRYVPIWDRQGGALLRFRIVPGEGAQPDPVHRAHQPVGAGATQQSVAFSADMAALNAVSAEIVRLAGLDRRLPVICPIHAGALEFPALRRELADAVRHLPPNVRQLLTLELTAPPFWTRSLAMEKFVEEIRGMKVGLASCVPLSREALAALGCLPGPVTIQLPTVGLPEPACLKFLTAFVARASKLRLECGVAGAGTRAIALAAANAGVRFVSGPAIHPEITALDRAVRFALAEEQPRADVAAVIVSRPPARPVSANA